MNLTGQLGNSLPLGLGLLSTESGSIIDVSCGDTLVLSESNSVAIQPFRVSAEDTLNLTETHTVKVQPLRVNVSETLFFTETARIRKVFNFSSFDVLAFEEIRKINKAQSVSSDDTLSFTEEVFGEVFIVDVSDSLTFSETANFERIVRLEATDNLAFDEQAQRQAVLNLEADDQLIFLDSFLKTVGSITFNVPEAQVLKVENLFTIQGAGAGIALPNPLFDDVRNNTDILTLYRSRSNKIYTYVKKQEKQQLSFTFELERNKSFELQQFFSTERANQLRLVDHRSQVWFCFLLTNPIDYTAVKRGEITTVQLDFEGVRVL